MQTKDFFLSSFLPVFNYSLRVDMITFTEFKNLSTDQKNEEILRKLSFHFLEIKQKLPYSKYCSYFGIEARK